MAKHFRLPTMVVFDCDGNTPEDEPGKPTGRRKQQEEDNKAIFSLMGVTEVQPFPTEIIWSDGVVAWPNIISDVIESEIGEEIAKFKDEVRDKRRIDLPNMGKNPLFIGYVMARAWEAGRKSRTLETLCDHILKFAAAAQARPG